MELANVNGEIKRVDRSGNISIYIPLTKAERELVKATQELGRNK